jgi:hypothetical protein
VKIEVTSDIQVKSWHSPIVIVTQNEYLKADFEEINRVVAMLCNINCFERQLTEMEHEEILKVFHEFGKGCKVFFGIVSNSSLDTERHLEVSILTPSKHLLAISKYDKSTGDFYVIERTFRARQ